MWGGSFEFIYSAKQKDNELLLTHIFFQYNEGHTGTWIIVILQDVGGGHETNQPCIDWIRLNETH